MSWKEDGYWVAAFEAALRATHQADIVLVATPFVGLHEKFVPLEYSWGINPSGRRIAWCCTKDDAHRLATWVHTAYGDRSRCGWANEVFILCANFAWKPKATSDSIRHWHAWRDKVMLHLKGGAMRPDPTRPQGGAQRLEGPQVLVIGASGMGNVGDDLLAQVLTDMLRRVSDARVWLSHSDIDVHQLKRFSAVVVGGGGLIYASRDGSNETQNLANYLKLGPMCAEVGIPVALMGVSDQDHAGGLFRDATTEEFAGACLARFAISTTRDADSAALLARLGLPRVEAGPDLLFAWHGRAKRAAKLASPGAKVAIGGELMGVSFLAEGLRAELGLLRDTVAGLEIDILMMSDDDVPHSQRLKSLLGRLGATVAVEDLRGRDLESLVHAVRQYKGLITTRFHGLVTAALSGVPVLAIDVAEGKKTRLLRELSPDGGNLLPVEAPAAEGLRRFCEALKGGMSAISPAEVSRMARTASVHEQALKVFLSAWPRPGGMVAEQSEDVQAGEPVVPLPPRPEVAMRYRTSSLVSANSDDGGSVGLCWAASTRETEGFGNLGDSLSAVVVSALSGRRVQHVSFDRPQSKLVAVGSIGHAICTGEAIIWGSGVSVRGGVLPQSVRRTHYDVRAIRGPISGGHLRAFGIPVPEVYGDPVWLLPSIFHENVEKRFELGVIPHIQDVDGFGPHAVPPPDSLRYKVGADIAHDVKIINTWHDPTWEGIKQTLRLILSCKRIVSQSFHGVVIAEAYGIPVLNFRQLPGVSNGEATVDLTAECATDPRIWEFYRGGASDTYRMYVQRRNEPTDWGDVIRTVDRCWTPFEYDPSALIEAFPLPLAYDPLRDRADNERHLAALRF